MTQIRITDQAEAHQIATEPALRAQSGLYKATLDQSGYDFKRR
jgi:hypothetical protein